MSAVAPTPPPHSVLLQSTSPPSDGPRMHKRSMTSNANGPGPNGAGPSRGPYPHIKDLIAQAEVEVAQTMHTPINRLIDMADNACRQALTLLEWKRPVLAYKEYIAVNLLITDAIPRHKDFPVAKQNPRLSVVYRNIIMRVDEHHAVFDQIGAEINQDNISRGTVQTSKANVKTQAAAAKLQKARPTSMQVPRSLERDPSAGTSMYTDAPSRVVQSSSRPKPPVSPKPQSLQRNAASPAPSTTSVDALADRFANLRRPNGISATGSQNPHPVDEPLQPPPSSYSRSESRMAPSPVGTVGQQHPLPALPNPTYTPNRAMPGTPSASQTRGTAESGVRPLSQSSAGSGTTSHLVNGDHPHVYYANTQASAISDSQSHVGERRRRAVSSGAVEQEISAERLFDYLKTFLVMLIDVRSRDAYDNGHIMATSSICIEPTALRPNMSAEELEDSLVLSPDSEVACFQRRDQFDLVVYYDESSTGATGQNLALRYLHEALTNFNAEKPLDHPPILLSGGVEAWIDLLGPQVLQSSNTVARAGSKGRPIARRPLVTGSEKLGIQRRKRRDYNPLDPEEEKKWRERARSESLVLAAQIQHDGPQDSEGVDEGEPLSPSLQDFQQRFPDLGALSQQQTRYEQPPSRPAPQIPSYPTPPPPSFAAPAPPSYPNHAPPAPPVPARPPLAARGVSERHIVSPTTSVSQQLPPYIPPKLKRLPKTGLHNYGVTCYMNATIQCMSATLPLTAFFLDNSFVKYIQKDNWKGSKGVLPELYCTLIKNLWLTSDANTLKPKNFRNFCARLNKEWGIDRQQDAKEFLEFLIDCLHEDFNINWQRNPVRALTEAEEAMRESMPTIVASKIEWERYLHRDHSRLTDLFAGQHISRLKCAVCGHSSTTYEPFYSISVEIPKVPHAVSIYDCLKSYCSEEKLSGDEVWRCPKCKTEREATKRITITRVPEFLVVHFKRFSAGHSERARKITTPIDFPLDGLNMEPFVNPLPPAPQLQELLQRDANLMTPAVKPPFKYEAYAVMRHIGGTLTSGHYIALVRDRARGLWREFNDSRVTDFRPADLPHQARLQNDQAYIVFYQRTE